VSYQTITLGTEDQIQWAMTDIFDDPYAKQHIYPAVAKSLAGRQLAPQGVNLAYDLAVYDAMKARELPGQVALVFSMFKDDLIEAIIGVGIASDDSDSDKSGV
jgi:hypothetical protein